jgi:hypothetical protein
MDFAREVMVNLEGDRLRRRIDTITRGRNRQEPSREEAAALALIADGGYAEAAYFLRVLVENRNRRVFKEVCSDPCLHRSKERRGDLKVA